MSSRDITLKELGSHFKDIAEWAVDADEFEVMIVNEEMGKLMMHLRTMKIVQEATKLPDLMDDAEVKTGHTPDKTSISSPITCEGCGADLFHNTAYWRYRDAFCDECAPPDASPPVIEDIKDAGDAKAAH